VTFDFLKMHIDIELYGTSSSIYIPLKLFEKDPSFARPDAYIILGQFCSSESAVPHSSLVSGQVLVAYISSMTRTGLGFLLR
jgi:hypothetical protein